MSKQNKRFGRNLANALFGTGIKEVPFLLGSEEADAFQKRWKELQKGGKK